jgi:hypothetical protein
MQAAKSNKLRATAMSEAVIQALSGLPSEL